MNEIIIGILIAIPIVVLVVSIIPLLLWIEFKLDCKKYGEETAIEIRRRFH